MDIKICVIEDIMPSDKDINDELIALTTYYDQEIEMVAYEFTFISQEVASLEEIPQLKEDKFLSSAVIINFKKPDDGKWRSYLFSAIVTIPKITNHSKFGTMPLLNNYLHIYKTFPCVVSISEKKIHEFNITGTFFCQQNSITSVCAHASLCMTINNMNLQKVGIISPEHINKIVGINHKDIRLGSPPSKEGLTKEEIVAVLQQYGLSITWKDFFENPNIEYNDYIYKYLESRCPVLLVFSTSGTSAHIVPVLGHTLNSDMWRPEAEPAYSSMGNRLNYKPASAWIDHFIIHDDNFGMYFCLPVEALKRVTLPKYDPTFRAIFAVAVIPSGVTTPAWEAEWASVVVIKDMLNYYLDNKLPLDDWSKRIIASDPARRPIVIRTFLVNKDDYAKSLTKKDFEGNKFSEQDKENLIKDLPFRFWLSEITLPDLYTANKTKLIDFFYDCSLPPLESTEDIFKRWIQIRVPSVLIKRDVNGSSLISPMTVKSHYPLLRYEGEQELLDW
ncbi:MAG: hypothetical protein Q8M34_07140 [Thermodesulfovibrionales bacterium]|nr:hypothetical protein [Thermodesulfovibrionales bacterium]